MGGSPGHPKGRACSGRRGALGLLMALQRQALPSERSLAQGRQPARKALAGAAAARHRRLGLGPASPPSPAHPAPSLAQTRPSEDAPEDGQGVGLDQ